MSEKLPSLVVDAAPPAGAESARESEFLSPVGKKIRDEIAGMVPLLRRNALEGEELGALAPETIEAMHHAGVFKITLPEEVGGYALGARDIIEIVTALGRGDGAAGWTVIVSSAIRNSLGFPQETVDEIFGMRDTWVGPLMFGASVLSTSVGAARRVEGGLMVSGKWSFGSACKHAAWGAVGVEYEDEGGRPRRGMAILSRDQYQILDDWKVMGLKATSSNSVTVDGEVFVPERRFVHTSDLPRIMDDLRSRYGGRAFGGAVAVMVTTTASFAALALGMARGTLECFVEQAKNRRPFNLPYPTVADMPSAQVVAGKARAIINAAEAVVHLHADEVDRRTLQGMDFSFAEEPEITMDLIHAIHQCGQVIDMLQLALGSSTVSLKNPIQRFARDMRVLATHGGLRLDPMAEINGRNILGLTPFPLLAAFEPPTNG